MKIGNINIDRPLILAPMEDVTDMPFRLVCKKLGADIPMDWCATTKRHLRK
jgi:tRNA-dihydrouridine synthase B